MRDVEVCGLVRVGRDWGVFRRGPILYVRVHIVCLVVAVDDAEILPCHLFEWHIRAIEIWLSDRVCVRCHEPMCKCGVHGDIRALRIELMIGHLVLLEFVDEVRVPAYGPRGSSISVQLLSSVHIRSLCVGHRSSASWKMCGHPPPSTGSRTLVSTARLCDFRRPFEVG